MATMTSAGAIPSSPTALLNAEIEAATALSPGLTANLPGSLIEDMASTAAGAVVIQDQAFVDLVNSISPYSANAPILYELGAVYGVAQGQGSNTSVYVTFTGTPGFVIPVGFVVSDGSYQYAVQDGGIVASSGQSAALYCLATVSGSWAVSEGTVTVIVTSIPSGVSLSCSNLSTGIPGASAQTLQAYQAQVIQAGQAVAQGMPTFLKTQLENVSGVQSRLVSVQLSGSNWQIIVGGGDPYEVANAIYTGLFDISNLVGSTLLATAISNANPGVIATNINHEYSTGQLVQFTNATGTSGINNINNVAISTITWSASVVTVTLASAHGIATGNTATAVISGCTPIGYNGTYTMTSTGTTTFTYPLVTNPGTIVTKGTVSTYFVATVTSPTVFSINTNTTSSGAYSGGAVVTPNSRNITVSINDYPNTYSIPFINPPAQQMQIALTWNTISTNYVSPTSVAAAGIPAIVNYINSIAVGQPINVFEMQAVFQTAVINLIPTPLISKMNFVVTWNAPTGNIILSPSAGTGLIYGDSQSFFETSSASVTVVQG